MTASSSDDILFETANGWGVVTMNRPAALNALTSDMVVAYRAQLAAWSDDPSVNAVLVKGAGEKAFCAGGDIRWLRDTAQRDPDAACDFFRAEYANNVAIQEFAKPYVSLIDGVVMGGGVGVSVHGDFRVAGDRTLFAMPETGIGLVPDVGGGHFLPRLKDGLGLYYGLTGARAKAADCIAAGVATHYVPTDAMADLEARLFALAFDDDPYAAVKGALDAAGQDPGAAPVDERRALIAKTFTPGAGVDDVLAALKAEGSETAQAIAGEIARMSPTSLKLTAEQLRRGADLDFRHVMRMEFRLVHNIMRGHDFFEGVRAQIIDKDRNPSWSPPSLDAVDAATVAGYFADLGDKELALG
ncbi:MAG: enoyl-CoA hydratase/isomerase family protein [Pseudomonadota bacterium]